MNDNNYIIDRLRPEIRKQYLPQSSQRQYLRPIRALIKTALRFVQRKVGK